MQESATICVGTLIWRKINPIDPLVWGQRVRFTCTQIIPKKGNSQIKAIIWWTHVNFNKAISGVPKEKGFRWFSQISFHGHDVRFKRPVVPPLFVNPHSTLKTKTQGSQVGQEERKCAKRPSQNKNSEGLDQKLVFRLIPPSKSNYSRQETLFSSKICWLPFKASLCPSSTLTFEPDDLDRLQLGTIQRWLIRAALIPLQFSHQRVR